MKKGLTLVTISAIVLVISILATTVTISGSAVINNSKKIKFSSELLSLTDTVKYYRQTHADQLPIKGEKLDIDNLPGDNYYEIDFSLLGITDTIYGKKNDGDSLDMYVIDKNSGEIYYAKGLKVGDTIYYNLNSELKEIVGYKEDSVVSKDGINFNVSITEFTNQPITAYLQVPSDYKNIVVSSKDSKLTPTQTAGSYNEYNITKSDNFDMVVTYIKDNVKSKQVFTVSNFDNTTPSIEVKNKTLIDDKLSITINTNDNLSGVKLVKYETSKQDIQYFKNDLKGINVSNNNIVIDKNIKCITFYVEDNAGNSSILVVNI